MLDYVALKSLDSALSPPVPDPAEAAAAINAQTIAAPSDLPARDAREVVLLTGEWASIKRLAGATLSGVSPPSAQDQAIIAAGLCVDTLTLVDVLHVADAANWAAVQQQVGALQAAGVLSAASAAKWAAMRNQVRPAFAGTATKEDIIAARTQF